MDSKEQQNTQRKKKGIAGLILAILLLLNLLSAVLLAIRLLDYIGRDSKEVLLRSNMDTELELFAVQYENATGEITVVGAEGQDVVAPGTSMDYTIRLRNEDKGAVDCFLSPDLSFTTGHSVPILIRMQDEDGNYLIGSADKWASVEEASLFSKEITLLKGESAEFLFQWKWEFESGNDDRDTLLGSLANMQDVGIRVKMDLHSEANTALAVNGGVIGSGLGEILLWGILLWILLVLLILWIRRMIQKRREELREAQEMKALQNEQEINENE